MFNTIDHNSSSVLKNVYQDRIAGVNSSQVVINALSDKHDFGKETFAKILSKTILKPGSRQIK